MTRATVRLAAGILAWASFAAAQPQRVPFPADGTLTVKGSAGDLTVEGWDRNEIELTATVVGTHPGIKVALESAPGGASIVTTLPKRTYIAPSEITYKVFAPRGAKLVVEHINGDVHAVALTGDIQASVRAGALSVQLPPSSSADAALPKIDAKAKLGEVTSDFTGSRKSRWKLFQHALTTSGQGQKLYLRVCYGDIIVLRSR